MKTKILLVVLIVALLVPNLQAQAAEPKDTPTNYCFPVEVADRCLGAAETITALLGEWGLNLAIGTAKTVDGLIWLLDRAAAFIFDVVVNSDWLIGIKDQLLTALGTLMPGILREMVLGNTGLMYVAMALAGLLMILPLVGAEQTRLVRPERVMLWGVLLALLFLGGASSVTGYDLVNTVEGFRLTLMKNIVGTTENPADKLIQSPMGASSREFESDDLLKLPPAYESLYFPEAQTIEVTVKFFPQIGPQNTFIETKDSARSRASLAGSSVFFSFISLLGAYALLLFAITFAFLGVAALVLILFLFAALPLGFFEFGNIILKNIIEKYMQIVVFSLGISIFIRWVVVWISSFPDASDVESALTWASLLLVVVAVLHVILSGAFGTLISSAQVFSGSVQTVFSGGAVGLNSLGTMAGNLGGGQMQAQENIPAMASALTSGALSAVGFRAVGSLFPENNRENIPVRADVFRMPDAPEAESTRRAPRPQNAVLAEGNPLSAERKPTRSRLPLPQNPPAPVPDEIPRRPVFAPNPAESEASLQTLVVKEPVEQPIKPRPQRSDDAASLVVERPAPDSLAQKITSDAIAGARPLIKPKTE